MWTSACAACPFAPDEMSARAEVLLRRRHGVEGGNRLRVADLELDLVRHVAHRNGQLLNLLPTEFRLLEFLMRNSGQVVTRTMIFETVWGFHFDPGTNVIDVHIGRLRRKIDSAGQPALIRTVRGTGYMLAPMR
jgi:two-component system, OmpR family, response regulator